MGLYASGRGIHAKEIVFLLQAKNFELNGIRDTQNHVSAFIRFVCDRSNESLKTNGFRKLPVFIDRTTAMKVINAYKKNLNKEFLN